MNNINYIPPEVFPAAVHFWLMGEEPGRGRNLLPATPVIFISRLAKGEGKMFASRSVLVAGSSITFYFRATRDVRSEGSVAIVKKFYFDFL